MKHFNGAICRLLPNLMATQAPAKTATKAAPKETPVVDVKVVKQAESVKTADIAPKEEAFCNLQGRIWLPENLEDIKVSKNRNGKLKLTFSASLSRYNEQAGKYISTRFFNFSVTDNGHGPLATEILSAHSRGERLIEQRSQVDTWEYQGKFYETWLIIGFNVVPRPNS